MKIPVGQAKCLLQLKQGLELPLSSVSKHLCNLLLADEVIVIHRQVGRGQSLRMLRPELLDAYLKNKFGISDLSLYISTHENSEASRADYVNVSGDSKLKNVRSFTGFPVNVLKPTECSLQGNPFTIHPQQGAFTFISDYNSFDIPEDMTVVGIENPTNFNFIHTQAHLFTHIHPFFVSRYPQTTDLRKWLMRIPNNYLHFGDFDFAGINIYCHEFYRHIPHKARFFMPDDIEMQFRQCGLSARYNDQSLHEEAKSMHQDEILRLIALIHQYKKGVDQEIYV